MAKRSAIAPTVTKQPTHFVVERLNWRRADGERFYRYPGSTRIASFDSADEAEKFRRDNEAIARAAVNPFAGSLASPTEQTSLPENVFCDWLTDHGIDPPKQAKKTGQRDWSAWWEKSSKKWNDAQRSSVWDRLDRVSFFRVSERPKRPVVYAVVKVVWGYNDEWYYPGSEGGETLTVYRSHDKAEKVAAEMNSDAREEWGMAFTDFDMGYEPAGLNQFDLEGRLLPGQNPFGEPITSGVVDEEGEEWHTFAPEQVAFFEVVEIELEGGA
jgi:hypothetical protein